MGHRDSLYRLSGVIEIDDALVGGKRKGKRGRGAAGKTSALVAVESKGKRRVLLLCWPSIVFAMITLNSLLLNI